MRGSTMLVAGYPAARQAASAPTGSGGDACKRGAPPVIRGRDPGWARAVRSLLVVGVAERAGAQRQAAAADTPCELGFQALEVCDLLVDPGRPVAGDPGPVGLRGRSVVGQAV